MIDKLIRKMAHLWNLYLIRDEVTVGVRDWYKYCLNERVLHVHELPPKAVVIDVGGFTGEWVGACHTFQPAATYHVFEPLSRYVAHLKKRFAKAKNVKIHPFGLAAEDGTVDLSVMGEGSSQFRVSGEVERVTLRDVTAAFKELSIKHVHLMAMNAEGAEYMLLPMLLDKGWMPKIDTLFVQFHKLDGASVGQREAIRGRLAKTHVCVMNFPFVWEKWVRRPV
jgi:FkbM family methyltransferase